MKAYPHSWRWIIMGLVAVLIRIALSPALIEKLYSRAVYQALRAVWDHLLNSWLPVPLMYLLLLLALALLVQRTR
ncbi:MAG: hypothetical protein KDC54_23270, partial [Lewinella sp.]|nr:hypothetical protein [Lewinella sp.]